MKGKVWKFGDNINTDEVIPPRYLNRTEPEFLAEHCMEGIDPEFVQKMSRGDIIVGGENFGCGSSREHAPIAIKAVGISCVIAKSFARIFCRNSINIALPIVECREAVDEISEGDEVEVDISAGVVRNVASGKTFSIEPFPEEMQQIFRAGGLMEFVKQKVR